MAGDFAPDEGTPAGSPGRAGRANGPSDEDMRFLRNYKVRGPTTGRLVEVARVPALTRPPYRAPTLACPRGARHRLLNVLNVQPTPEDAKLMRECSENIISDSERSRLRVRASRDAANTKQSTTVVEARVDGQASSERPWVSLP